MKKIFITLLSICMFFTANIASIVRTISAVSVIQLSVASNVYAKSDSEIRLDRLDKNRITASIFAIFSLHHFYLKNYGTGALYVLLNVFFGAGIILSWIDIIIMFCMSDKEWDSYLKSNQGLLYDTTEFFDGLKATKHLLQ